MTSIYAPDIYELTDAGAALLRNVGQYPPYNINSHMPRGTGERKEFTHAKMIAKIMADLQIGANTHGLELVPQELIERGFDKDDERPLEMSTAFTTMLKGKHHSFEGTIQPDALTTIVYPDGRKSNIALEYNNAVKVRRNNLNLKSVMRQILGYTDCHTKKTYQKEWNLTGTLRVCFAFA